MDIPSSPLRVRVESKQGAVTIEHEHTAETPAGLGRTLIEGNPYLRFRMREPSEHQRDDPDAVTVTAEFGSDDELAACERWQMEHVAGDVTAPGWYDALTTRMLSDASDSLVSAFGAIESKHTDRGEGCSIPRTGE